MLNSRMTNDDYLISLLRPLDTQILDFGSGRGALVKKLHDAKFKAVGCDILEWYVEYEGQRINELLLGTDLVLSTDNTIPFNDGHFTTIVSNQVIEHISDLDAIALELHRVIKMDGLIYLLFPVKEALIEPHTKIPFLHYLNPTSVSFGILVWIKLILQNFLNSNNGHPVSIKQKLKETREYFEHHVHFRELNDIKSKLEGVGFEVSDETSKWFTARYSHSLVARLVAFFVQPKYFIGTHLVLKKVINKNMTCN